MRRYLPLALGSSLAAMLVLAVSTYSADSIRWVSGDIHLHTESHNPERSLTLDQIREEMLSQDLEVGSVLIWGVRPELTTKLFAGNAHDYTIFGRGQPIARVDLETSSFQGGFPDHMIALGLHRADFPIRLFSDPIYAWAQAQGAVVGAAHGESWTSAYDAFPDRSTQVPSDFPVSIALDRPLFLATQLLNSEGFRFLWYNLLNCGYRIPIAAGSDWPVAGTHAGETRTYVAIEGDDLTYRKWIDGIRAGRTTIAQGKEDMVVLSLNNAAPGQESRQVADGYTEYSITVTASRPQKLELILNGDVIVEWEVPTGTTERHGQLSFEKSAWLAARTEMAHTGASYLKVDGKPFVPRERSVRYFLAYLDNLEAQTRSSSFTGPINGGHSIRGTEFEDPRLADQERVRALALIGEARSAFRKLLGE